MGHEQHTVAVFAPILYLTVTVEAGSSGTDEVHIHPGGQGFWVARMLRHLGERPLLCGPVGGEAGQVFTGLLRQWGMDVSTIEINASTPIIVQDRRSGDRQSVANSPPISLERHEIDDIYGRFLDRSLASALCVVTGQPDEIFPIDIYRRLGHDLDSGGVEVVADLHGPELERFLEGGPIEILKVSDEDLASDGLLAHKDVDESKAMRALDTLTESGAQSVVLSRHGGPALARFGARSFQALAPELDPADHRGAGDSMTAGLAAALRQGLAPEPMLQLACAAGAANVTRHGLGSTDGGLIRELAGRVTVRQLATAT